MAELIITNGDCVAQSMRAAGFKEEILSWNDVLHDGPVPGSVDWDELMKIRANFLSIHFGEEPSKVKQELSDRQDILNRLMAYDRISLWYEHDLFDQLQLTQILDYLSRMQSLPPVYMMQADTYLGTTPPPQLPALREKERPLTQKELEDGANFWRLFTGSDPRELHSALTYQGPLRYLPSTTRRLLQTFPYRDNGLTLTQRYALKHLQDRSPTVASLFGDYWMQEDIKYLGDWSFVLYLEELVYCPKPLIEGYSIRFSEETTSRRKVYQQKVSLTQSGNEVIRGEKNHITLNGIDRWIGGTHLTPDNLYGYDPDTERLVKVEEN